MPYVRWGRKKERKKKNSIPTPLDHQLERLDEIRDCPSLYLYMYTLFSIDHSKIKYFFFQLLTAIDFTFCSLVFFIYTCVTICFLVQFN